MRGSERGKGSGPGAPGGSGLTAAGAKFRRSWAQRLVRLRGRHLLRVLKANTETRRALNRRDSLSRDPLLSAPHIVTKPAPLPGVRWLTAAPPALKAPPRPAVRMPPTAGPPAPSAPGAAPPPAAGSALCVGRGAPSPQAAEVPARPHTLLPLTSGGPEGGGTRPPEESGTTAPRGRGLPRTAPARTPARPLPPAARTCRAAGPAPGAPRMRDGPPAVPTPHSTRSQPAHAQRRAAAAQESRPPAPPLLSATCPDAGVTPAESGASEKEEPGAAGTAPQHVARLGRRAPSQPARPHRVGASVVPPSPDDWQPGEPVGRRVREASGGAGGRLPMKKERGRGRAKSPPIGSEGRRGDIGGGRPGGARCGAAAANGERK